MLTKEDWNEYYLGSPYWHSIHDRILVPGVNDAEFWVDLFEGKGGKSFKKNLDCPENRLTLLLKYQELNPNEPIIRSQLNELAYRLMITGNPVFIYPHLEPEAPADDRPRDSLGRIMSPKAIQWQQWEAWCSSPETKMADIKALRQNNKDFAEFYAEQTKRAIRNPEEAATQTPSKKKVSDAVQQFAAEFRTLPVDRLRVLLSPGKIPSGLQTQPGCSHSTMPRSAPACCEKGEKVMSWSNREIISYGQSLLGSWKKKNAEILSCYDLVRLQDRMQAYADLEMGKQVMQELYAASETDRDADAVAAIWFKVYNQAFVTLYDRGVLAGLTVVDAIPTAAQAQLDAMVADVASYHPEPVAEVAAPVVVQIDPVALCVKEFHEMGSTQFAAKYLKDTRNRPTYEAAIDRGLL